MPVATADKRGLKRICMSCSTRYYDFNKRPVICPNCGAEFTGDIKIRTRRTRPVAEEYDEPIIKSQLEGDEVEDVKEDEVAEVVEDEETVSLEEVEELDEGDDVEEEDVDADLELDADDLDDDIDDDDDDDDDDEEDDDEEEE